MTTLDSVEIISVTCLIGWTNDLIFYISFSVTIIFKTLTTNEPITVEFKIKVERWYAWMGLNFQRVILQRMRKILNPL